MHDVCKPCFPRQPTLHLFNNSVAATSGVSASSVILPKRMSAYPSLSQIPCRRLSVPMPPTVRLSGCARRAVLRHSVTGPVVGSGSLTPKCKRDMNWHPTSPNGNHTACRIRPQQEVHIAPLETAAIGRKHPYQLLACGHLVQIFLPLVLAVFPFRLKRFMRLPKKLCAFVHMT